MTNSSHNTIHQVFGRQKVVVELAELLSQYRLINITGTGGVGKTTVAHELRKEVCYKYDDGVRFVSMATLNESDTIMVALANQLGITEANNRQLSEGVSNVIGSQDILIILDNLEHIRSAPHEVLDLITSCPNVNILCTSRAPLNISPEYVYLLHPFVVPDRWQFEKLNNYASIQLFITRAQLANRNFEITDDNAQLIVDICHRLDGLPLAIELAAARLRILTAYQLLEQIKESISILSAKSHDIPQRHQTLQATIDWSYNLLTEQERILLRRLSIFVNGFNLDAVKNICFDHKTESHEIIDVLESLLEKGLIIRKDEQGRFTLLQIIKDYVSIKTTEARELTSLQMRYSNYYSKFAQWLKEGTEGNDQLKRIEQGIKEESNITACLEYLLSEAHNGNESAALRGCQICADLWMYWTSEGNIVLRKVMCYPF